MARDGTTTPASAKQLFACAAATVTIMVGGFTLYNMILVPAQQAAADDMVHERISEHSRRPHPGSVGREEFLREMQTFKELLRVQFVEQNRRLQRIEQKLD